MRRLLHLSTALLLVSGGLLFADRSPSQTVQREGFRAEGAFRATTLLGGAFPYDEIGPGGQLSVRHSWSSGVSIALGGIYAEPVDLDLDGSRRQRVLREQTYYGEVRYQVQESGLVQPYAGVRTGWKVLKSRSVPEANGSGVMGGILIGADVWAADEIAFRVNAVPSAFRLAGFLPDRPSSGQAWSLEAGVAYFFGDVTRDGDRDGVSDDEDACPGTPGGLEVTDDGCLPDSDGDGRPDLRDACPDTPAGARVDERGCARDGDGDGVPDARDRCPDTREGQPVDERGCVTDADGDGVADGLDACPDTPAGSEVGPRGCALDEDRDGVPDGRDRCPGTVPAAVADEEGCSEAQVGLRDGRFTLTGLPFRFREVQVNQGLEAQLEQIGAELQRDPDLSLEIRVHTDTVGPTQYNQEMSQRLADAARDFLLRRYPDLTRSRVQASGMGEAGGAGEGEEAGEAAGSSRVVFVVRGRDGGGGSR